MICFAPQMSMLINLLVQGMLREEVVFTKHIRCLLTDSSTPDLVIKDNNTEKQQIWFIHINTDKNTSSIYENNSISWKGSWIHMLLRCCISGVEEAISLQKYKIDRYHNASVFFI